MKKLFVVLVAVALVTSLASAQHFWGQGKMSYGAGAEVALPMGTWGDGVGMGLGGFGLFQYGLNEDMIVVGQVGYTMWMEKDQGAGYKTKASSLEFLGGVKYNLSKQVVPGFYAMAQVGIHSISTTVSVPAYNYGYGISSPAREVTGSDSKFVIIPAVGYQMGNLDFSVKYGLSSDIGHLALNVAYVMPL